MKRKRNPGKGKVFQMADGEDIAVPKARLHPSLKKFMGYCFYKSAILLRANVDIKFAKFGVVAPQSGMLVILLENGPLTQGELGEFMAMDKATMVRMIDNLEDKKLVTRTQSKTDRRANRLEITKAGEKMIEKLSVERKLAEDEFFEPLTKVEREQLASLIHKLATAVLG